MVVKYRVPTLEPTSKYIQPGQEDRVMRHHKNVLGRTVTILEVWDIAVYLRVLPTSHPSVDQVIFENGISWATVCWSESCWKWECRLCGPEFDFADEKRTTKHSTLKSALRKARRYTEARAGESIPNLTEWLARNIRELDSPFPTDSMIESRRKYEDWYWKSVEAEEKAFLDDHFGEDDFDPMADPGYDYEF